MGKWLRVSSVVAVIVVVAASLAFAAPVSNFVAHLAGANEVPPVDTPAQGQAVFQTDESETELQYRLIVANIENVVAAHIHLAAEGVNGPVVVFLFGPAPPGGGLVNGVLATGTITADDLIGPLDGQSLSALLDAIRAGNAYVNVHTDDGVPPANTGAGDQASGEIRGQLRTGGKPGE